MAGLGPFRSPAFSYSISWKPPVSVGHYMMSLADWLEIEAVVGGLLPDDRIFQTGRRAQKEGERAAEVRCKVH